MKKIEELRTLLEGIDGRGYKAYKDIEGEYIDKRGFFLFIDHVQGDPFASPSKIRIRIPINKAKFPEELFKNRVRRIAFEDLIARKVKSVISPLKRVRGTGKSGLIHIDSGKQEVLERTACKVAEDWIEIRIYIGLPAEGRRILSKEAEKIFFDQIPRIVKEALIWDSYDKDYARRFIECVENQEYIRDRLKEKGIVAFIKDGSILPRESGISQLPLKDAIPFVSPPSLRVKFELPNPVDGKREIFGMGIPEGVTLIVGGGYHGKSTLLQALERGVYPHIPRDGREYVVTIPTAVKIKAEDGRRIEKVDISPFISNLPMGIDTSSFGTENASGSTSQAANIMEAIEIGSELLLLDEDTSATNFMIRDIRMQQLVSKQNEPITPFIDRVRELYNRLGISTILVMGGCGDYFDVADTVIMMKKYLPYDVTSEAKEIAKAYPNRRIKEAEEFKRWEINRIPIKEGFDPLRKNKIKIDAKDIDRIVYGKETIELKGVDQIVDISQARAIGMAIYLCSKRFMDNRRPLREILKEFEMLIDREGLDILDPHYRKERHPGSLARPRIFEIVAAMNRLRSARFKIS